MTRLLLSAVTLAGALLVPSAANACELQHCAWGKPICSLGVVDCADPVPTPCFHVDPWLYVC